MNLLNEIKRLQADLASAKQDLLDTSCDIELAVRRNNKLEQELVLWKSHAAELAQCRQALERIARWHGEFPKVIGSDGRTESYASCYGSNGERDFMRRMSTFRFGLKQSRKLIAPVTKGDFYHQFMTRQTSKRRYSMANAVSGTCKNLRVIKLLRRCGFVGNRMHFRFGDVGAPTRETKTLCCSFCGNNRFEVKKLIAGDPTKDGISAFICDSCVSLCSEIMEAVHD